MTDWHRSLGAAAVSAALACGVAGEAGAPSGEYLYVRLEAGSFGEKVLPDIVAVSGNDARPRLVKSGTPRFFRATPAGTVAAWDAKRLLELDRKTGRVLLEIPWENLEGWGLGYGTISVDPLPSGCFLVSGLSKEGDENAISAIVQIDRTGKPCRRITVPFLVNSVRALGDDRILVVGGSRILEIGWDGKEKAAFPLPKGHEPTDAVKLDGGGFLVASDTAGIDDPSGEGIKCGRVTEFDASGREIWHGKHPCPASVQPLPSGTVLVGGG